VCSSNYVGVLIVIWNIELLRYLLCSILGRFCLPAAPGKPETDDACCYGQYEGEDVLCGVEFRFDLSAYY